MPDIRAFKYFFDRASRPGRAVLRHGVRRIPRQRGRSGNQDTADQRRIKAFLREWSIRRRFPIQRIGRGIVRCVPGFNLVFFNACIAVSAIFSIFVVNAKPKIGRAHV